jgi:hypothetical protein
MDREVGHPCPDDAVMDAWCHALMCVQLRVSSPN